MYKEYYRFQSEPFSTHPNTDTFYISNTHKEAWYYLLFGIDTNEPFLVLTGEYGMGKTLLSLRLLKVLKEKGTPWVEYIPTSNEGYGGILRRMASSLGISSVPEDEGILQDMIYDCFRADTENSRFYLIIDDAHELDVSTLTKLKYLSTFHHNEFFPIIMIFVGHPCFLRDLRTPALSSLNQRIKRRYHLARFSLEDTKNYIFFRLLKSGATGIPAFPAETIQKIFEYSGGVPRLINNIADTCLLIGASKKLGVIPASVVEEAKMLVDGSLTEVQAESPAVMNLPANNESIASFSEDFPGEGTADGGDLYAAQMDAEAYPSTLTSPQTGGAGHKWRNMLIAAAVMIGLLLCALLFVQYGMKDRLFSLFSTAAVTETQKTPVEPVKAEAQPPKGTVEIPTLRGESMEKTDKASTETASPAVTGEGTPPPPPDGSAKQPAKTEPVAAGTKEVSLLHPYSLRSSGYQQVDLAAKEMAEVRQLGLIPYLVKTDWGDMGTLWRVYIGFYATEEEARKAKANYKLDNASVQKTEYACLVIEFSNQSDGPIGEKTKKAGYFPYVIQKDRNHFRLYVGAYEKKADAEVLRQELLKKGISSQVVKR